MFADKRQSARVHNVIALPLEGPSVDKIPGFWAAAPPTLDRQSTLWPAVRLWLDPLDQVVQIIKMNDESPDNLEESAAEESPPHESPDEVVENQRPRSTLKKLAVGMLLGCAIGVVLGIVIIANLHRDSLPVLSPAELVAAEAKWKEKGAKDYDLDLDASLGLTGKMHVEVRHGATVSVTLNNQPTREHIWDYWSVAGLFEVMKMDADRNQAAARETGDKDSAVSTGQIFQQARFDAQNGLPLEYRRTDPETGRSGGWRITRFQAIR